MQLTAAGQALERERGTLKGAGRAGASRGPAAVAAEASAPRPEGAGFRCSLVSRAPTSPTWGRARVLPAPLLAH